MKQHSFHRILIANRGEIALRVIQAVRQLDKVAVVVHSDFDRDLPFVTEADEAYSLGPGGLSDTYLHIEKILEVARIAHVDAIHPGYGFLSENPAFAEACSKAGIAFIGPSPDVIALMGNKSSARKFAGELGIPILDGITGTLKKLISEKEHLPYPLLIKPAGGGGGKGMRIVSKADLFESEAKEATREAQNYFGSGELYVERYLERPRHIEVQVIADQMGNAVHLFERECSLQRRYQKIIEEAPGATITEFTRNQITSVALQLIRGINYVNAGTIEFLMDDFQQFYFLEMNTRIQVEHPVTEMITGIDLVREQIRIAEGYPLSFSQQDVKINGHAIEARLYAEDPGKEFMPSSGRIETYEIPDQEKTRIDSGFQKGNLVEPYYDPMLAKVITLGKSREVAREQMIQSLKEVRITGLKTNRDFLIGILRSPAFKQNTIHTRFIEEEMEQLVRTIQEDKNSRQMETLLAAAALIALQKEKLVDGEPSNPWYAIGHWRILPEITLLADQQLYRIKYELIKGRERLRLFLQDLQINVSLEKRLGNNFWIRIENQVLKIWGTTDRSEILLDLDGHLYRYRRMDILDRRYIRSTSKKDQQARGEITAPLNGKIVQINVKEGEEVNEGDPLLVVESMKMENKILAITRARVKKIEAAVGQQVHTNQIIITLDPI